MAYSIWVLADERPGHRNQALGVAEALGLPFAIQEIHYGPLGRLPNGLLSATLLGVTRQTRASLAPPWPDLVIAAGRRTAPVARWIRRRSGGTVRLVQLMDPGGFGQGEFDLIAIPGHDTRRRGGPNILHTIGAPNRVSAACLATERARWSERLAGLRRPLIALIVGGATHDRPFPPAMAADLGAQVTRLAAQAGGAIAVTTSPRTGRVAEKALLAALPGAAFVHRWSPTGENPYYGLLASADISVVTGESASMLSEACATGGAVYVFAPPGWVAPKHARFHADLFRQGLARPLGETFAPWTHAPLEAAADVARAIRERLGAPPPVS
ncbi:MAG: mitochondrial fission ELM1 family protein [Alphaproteobacteria bacterium]